MEHFLEEISKLERQGEKIKKINKEELEDLQEAFKNIKEAKRKAKQAKKEESAMASRRDVLKGAAGVIAAGSIRSGMEAAKSVEEKRSKERLQSYIEGEFSRRMQSSEREPSTEGPVAIGYRVQELESGVFRIQALGRNNSSSTQTIDLLITIPSGWGASSPRNIDQGRSTMFLGEFEAEPGEDVSCSIVVTKNSGEYGDLCEIDATYHAKGSDSYRSSELELRLGEPKGVNRNDFYELEKEHYLRGPITLDYEVNQISHGEPKFDIEVSAENDSNQDYIVQLVIPIPSDWAVSGVENVQSMVGQASSVFNISPGRSKMMGVEVFQVTERGPNRIEVIVAYHPEGQKEDTKVSRVEIPLR